MTLDWLWHLHCRWLWSWAQSPITIKADITITTTMTAGATHIQDLVPGWISRGVTTLERSGTEAAMTGAETEVVTVVTGISLTSVLTGFSSPA
ncbi:hypothetical protein SKTS_21000 [Sulfurimicrobium lacus]|uniref:Uncharacterized protein n=1 Tax=Sulfurimicrobium lacus TaxID=2715678 RepID=A0A6F8VC22_9PROT|nr:hypothetical protein SKTS_21000 [Sulfurimicrobium lacus]